MNLCKTIVLSHQSVKCSYRGFQCQWDSLVTQESPHSSKQVLEIKFPHSGWTLSIDLWGQTENGAGHALFSHLLGLGLWLTMQPKSSRRAEVWGHSPVRAAEPLRLASLAPQRQLSGSTCDVCVSCWCPLGWCAQGQHWLCSLVTPVCMEQVRGAVARKHWAIITKHNSS